MSLVHVTGNRPSIPWTGQGMTHNVTLVGNASTLLITDVRETTVTLNLRNIFGEKAKDYVVTVALNRSGISKRGFLIAKTKQTVLTDENGSAVFSLWANEGTLRQTHYTLTVYDPGRGLPVIENARFVVGFEDSNMLDLLEDVGGLL